MSNNDWITAPLNFSFRQNSNHSVNSHSEDLHPLEVPSHEPSHSPELIYAHPNKPKHLFRQEDDRSENSLYKDLCNKLRPSTHPTQKASPFADSILSFERTKSNTDTHHTPNSFIRLTHPLDDNIAHLLNFQNSFCKDDDFELSHELKMPVLHKNFSIFGNKGDEHERPLPAKLTPIFKDFDRLANFLIKFYKCHSIQGEDYEFSREDISILKSFVKRKYKKKIEPE